MTEERYVVLKLISGEQLLAVCEEESNVDITIKNPMLIRIIPGIHPITRRQVENISASPWCAFVETKEFTLEKSKLLFVKEMHNMVTNQYLKMVEDYETPITVRQTDDGYIEAVDDNEELTVEDIKEQLDEFEEKWKVTFIKGNDSIN